MSGLYLQYGSGPLSAPAGWRNYDSSPRLRVQRLPIVGTLLKNRMRVTFHDDVMVGDILKGIPKVDEGTCDGVYCSHVLEHLAYDDCILAIRNSYRLLKRGGLFRCVVPDLAHAASSYVGGLAMSDPEASVSFMTDTMLGKRSRSRGVGGVLQAVLGNSDHLYMWDEHSLSAALAGAGFRDIRRCDLGDSPDPMFRLVEEASRFVDAVALEARR